MSYYSYNYSNRLQKTVFQHPELTRIQGEPTTQWLLTLQNKVKANAKSIHSTLGGRQHGHLGLVLSDTEYDAIPNTQRCVRPTHPGHLNISNTATQYQIATLRETHNENLLLFNEVTAVERAFIQQILAASLTWRKYPRYWKKHSWSIQVFIRFLWRYHHRGTMSTMKQTWRLNIHPKWTSWHHL